MVTRKSDPGNRVPLEGKKRLPLPPFSAALGMAASYYLYPVTLSLFPLRASYALLGILFFLAAALCVLRVLEFPKTGIKGVSIRKAGVIAAAAVVGFSLGIAARRSVPGQAEMGLPAERINSVSGILREDPRTLHGGSGLAFLDLGYCGGPGGLRASARGRLTVFFPAESIPRVKEFGRGSEIYAEGVYGSGRQGPVFNAVAVHVVRPAPAIETFRTGLRVTLLEKFQGREGPPVWGSFASALLLGVRDDLDQDLSDDFVKSGCAHILALSGMHLAIISGVLAFLLKRPLGIRWASVIGAVFIVFYVFIAGSQPSLVRAAIMFVIAAFALCFSLKGATLSLLGMAFIIQLLFQSETGVSLSFILSYLALLGMLTLGESLRSLFRGRLPEILSGGLSASLGAFVITSPVVAYCFGSLRPIGLIAGLIIAPVSSLFMIFALAALAAGFLPLPFRVLPDFILTQLYRLIKFLVSAAGSVPGLPVSSPAAVLAFVIVFWLLILFAQRKDRLYRNSIASFD